MRSSAPVLAALQTIPKSSLLLLLTPVLPTPGQSKSSGDPLSKTKADPFEPLGRELATHHSRIRHVPYLPNQGLSTVHRGFLQEANAVIVAICTSDDMASLDRQMAIAREIANLSHVPAVLVVFGDAEAIEDVRVLDAYSNVIRAGEVEKRMFEAISRTLFEARK
ncbi:hypothetical protein LTR95_015351 [Oleoguttula sp. CCFEE 5521]